MAVARGNLTPACLLTWLRYGTGRQLPNYNPKGSLGRFSGSQLFHSLSPVATMPRVRGRSNASFSMSQSIDADDPLSRALQPPPDESPGERDERIRAEREAKRVSDEIDDQLRKERAALKKKRPVRVLLLGQSESGKSTTLKSACGSIVLVKPSQQGSTSCCIYRFPDSLCPSVLA